MVIIIRTRTLGHSVLVYRDTVPRLDIKKLIQQSLLIVRHHSEDESSLKR